MFAAMVSNSIGLYQFTVVVPNVAAGDQPIELSIGGVKNNQNLDDCDRPVGRADVLAASLRSRLP
jgi:hypothetical protein